MPGDTPDAAELAEALRASPFLDDATRAYWLALLPALDGPARQRLEAVLRGGQPPGVKHSPPDARR